MKKLAIIVSMGIIVFSCTPKASPTTSGNTTESANSNTTTTTTANTALIEQGHIVFESRCGRCHGLKDPTRYTSQRWDGILKSMIPKAKLNETEAQQVTAYVMANARK